LKDNGLEYGNISIPFYRADGFEFITKVEGMVFNVDNNGTTVTQELDKKSVFFKKVTDRMGEVAIAFPSIKAGSIIEYRYQSTMKHYGGLEDWHFQREIPVAHSKYVLDILPGHEFAYQVYKNPALDIKVDPNSSDARILFEMKNIPGLDDEPYMDARRDNLQRVTFQLSAGVTAAGNVSRQTYMTSWYQVTNELLKHPHFGIQLNKDLSGTQDFIKAVKVNPSPFEKMKLVYKYVKDNMIWNGYDSKFSFDGVKAAWSKKKGASGDLNLILVNLLTAAGLQAYPILISERYNGKVSTQYPFVDQFNTLYAAVFIDGRKYYLDATDKLTPPHIIPDNILNTIGFIVNKKAGGIVNIRDESLSYREVISISAIIAEEEKISGNAVINSTDYARIRRLERYSRNSSKYIDESFKTRASTIIDSFKLLNEHNDSLALQQKFAFSTTMAGTGDYRFIPLNLFSGFESNPFISDKRFSDVNFGYQRHITVNTHIGVPADYLVDALPKSVEMMNRDSSVVFIREVLKDPSSNNLVSCIKMDFKKSHYTVEEYADIKEFYKRIFDMLNEQIVLKKKTTP
jgi:transglutaminase-like putative cysteine protease